ncbi:alpha-galactosidase [Alteriqipengyuania sp. WL0013]|uniref:alpha-galactosidase n=1 Tax=Alteriqipengyuania sp. WL0013 TaxID=3110773 RepID=UPI002CFCAA5C|nr:alpha-galactosidase [Alteriqipengyuania sp. WL0013]MEB3414635.1 alpha-galactosidase [Alteriqipengyuania sp. WL0013]
MDGFGSEDGDRIVWLRGGATALALSCAKGRRPRILYCGVDIDGLEAHDIALLQTRQHVHGGPARPIEPTLLNESGVGLAGGPGLLAHRQGRDWAIDLRVVSLEADSGSATLVTRDKAAGVEVRHGFAIDSASGVLTAWSEVSNLDAGALAVEWCAALCLPLDDRLTDILGFTGRWAGEFAMEHVASFTGSYLRENRAGRTSHDCYPGLYLLEPGATEERGLCAAVHLGWSGNSRLRVDRLADGSASVQSGELLLPGEIVLASGEVYRTPDLHAVWSDEGASDVTRRLHRFVLESILDRRTEARPRKVTYNTWEAVYFDHSEAKLLDLAERAASVGAERFVLDDGWFGGRRSDAAGLGDWTVSANVYPDGLARVANHVRSLGMKFGIWFEPEMVNPDSDLFRAHPDWVFETGGAEPIASRNQLTLDLTKPELGEYLFARLDAIVRELGVAYIKWDMNRDTHHPVSAGRAAMHGQTRALYQLIDRLRAAHPELEIESCSSGGARADYGILRRTDRIWTSDNNDARDRQAIQRGANHFLPLSVTGSHVGPAKCHITGRVLPMELRAATAIMGHMGIEADLSLETEGDLAILSAATALYKQHRALIHGGDYRRLDAHAAYNAIAIVAAERGEAIVSCAQVEALRESHPPRLRIAGLHPARRYRLRQVWPQRDVSLTAPSIVTEADLLGKGAQFSGAALAELGLRLPLTYPDTCLIFHLEAAT